MGRKKVAIFLKIDVIQGPRKVCFLGGQFAKWIFAEGRSTRSPWSLEKVQGPIWRSRDHLVMKGLSKNVINHEF